MDKTHIVALSGGKDSTALAVRLSELNPEVDYTYLCNPTGDELPDMEAHWKNLECILGKDIIKVNSEAEGYETMKAAVYTKKCLPAWHMRWCTDILKISPAKQFYHDHKPCVVYVGLRADEETRKGGVFGDEVEQVFPFREWGWTVRDVWQYLEKKKIRIPRRTDCGMCFYQRIGEWWNLWKTYPERWLEYEKWEQDLDRTILTKGKFSNWPHALKDLRLEFENGRIPRGADDHHDMFPDFEQRRCRACTM